MRLGGSDAAKPGPRGCARGPGGAGLRLLSEVPWRLILGLFLQNMGLVEVTVPSVMQSYGLGYQIPVLMLCHFCECLCSLSCTATVLNRGKKGVIFMMGMLGRRALYKYELQFMRSARFSFVDTYLGRRALVCMMCAFENKSETQ